MKPTTPAARKNGLSRKNRHLIAEALVLLAEYIDPCPPRKIPRRKTNGRRKN